MYIYFRGQRDRARQTFGSRPSALTAAAEVNSTGTFCVDDVIIMGRKEKLNMTGYKIP